MVGVEPNPFITSVWTVCRPHALYEPLERQLPERLDQVSTYADQLVRWKRAKREREVTETRERSLDHW